MSQKPFYKRSPWPERFAEGWENMSDEHRKEFVRLSVDAAHQREYYAAMELMDYNGPRWEELTEEQRETIRKENNRYHKEMHELGQRIGRGEFK